MGALLLAAATLVASVVVVTARPDPAAAHGAAMIPGARTFLCWKDGLSPTGEIRPQNPACAAAVAQSGSNSLYNWFSVLRSDANGRTTGFIPDGQLCSGGATGFRGYDLARNDWPLTHLTAGRTMEFRYSNWAHHPGTFYFYVTKNTWSPTRALAWSDLEEQPFLTVTNPPQRGAVGTNDGHYYFTGTLPSNKSGRHIIYSRWVRSDSQENFFGCSDVTFDGGNGEVTGIGSGGSNPPPAGNGGCSATFKLTNSWSGGFQGEVEIRNTGTAPLNGWAASWTLSSGQQISQIWNATHTTSGSSVTARNVSYNGTVGVNGSTSFGFLASGTSSSPTITCAAS
ncbi:chitin-binding protein [Micromonospora craterilacus]|uniref:Chitin-binding protein n=1 Tax=Micromonospora craterilacus TaxID=1655439 RepID=A0A2W2DSK6_9ACTN|nr:chitin-binding protein [Micromonospora craterilacus]